MKTLIRIATAAAVLAIVQGCSNDDSSEPSSTCTPAVHTEPDAAAAEQFCIDVMEAMCARAYGDCPALGAPYATREECVAQETAICNMIDFSDAWYDTGCGNICMSFVLGASCGVLVSDDLQACDASIGFLAPPEPPPEIMPEVVATITAGTYADTITYSDPVWQGGHARAYAIYLAAGQTVTIETLPPTSGTGIGDSVVHLLSPTGTHLGSNDDGGVDLYSSLSTTISTTGYHRIVVRGYSTSRVGSYRLSVTIY